MPEVIGAAVCSFDTVDGAVQTVISTIQLGVPVARIELLDAVQVQACNRYSSLDLPEQPLLLLEFHGSNAGVEEQAGTVREIAEGNGGSGWAWASEPEQRNRLWKARHDAYYAALALRPGARGVPTDVCVPISRLADAIVSAQADIAETGLLAPIVGHVGDGNFHLIVVLRPRRRRRAPACAGACTSASSTAPSRWAAPAPASTASATASSRSSSRSTAPPSR